MIPTDILNYRVLRLIGSGGMGSVYLAANTNIDQQVAIKALRPEVARNAVLRAKFKQEAELLCSLDHPGIVKFLNYVETSDGVFLIMEYVKGVTLEDIIKKKNGLIVEKNEGVDAALGVLKRVGEISSDTSSLYEHLGDLYMKKGDKEKARASYLRAVELSDDGLIVLPRVQKKLRKVK